MFLFCSPRVKLRVKRGVGLPGRRGRRLPLPLAPHQPAGGKSDLQTF